MNFCMAKRLVFCFVAGICLVLSPLNAAALDGGYDVFSDLWLKSVLRTSAGSFTLIWKEVGRDITPSGDKVISGYFYADPDEFAYGSEYNPEVFVKIYVASNGWANIAFNHVTVDPVDVYSAHHYSGTAHQSGTVTLTNRLAEHSYTGVSGDADFTPPLSTADDLPYQDGGYILFSDLWGKSVLRTAAVSFTLLWKEVGNDTTPSGDKVISGYFYADPAQFAYGSEYNPELFVKIYVASNGWANIAFNHVTVDPIDVYSAHSYNGRPDYTGTATLGSRLAEHSYTGVSLESNPNAGNGGNVIDPGNTGSYGSRVSKIQQDNNMDIHRFSYDSEGRLIKWEMLSDGITDGITAYAYNSDDSIASSENDEDGDGTIDEIYTYRYDLNGRLIKIEMDDNYNGFGNIDRIETFFYDTSGRLNQVETARTYDGSIEEIESFFYDAKGILVRNEYDTENIGIMNDSDDTIDTYVYDANGWLSKLISYSPEDNWTTSIGFVHDTNGRIILWNADFGNNGIVDTTAQVVWEEGECKDTLPKSIPPQIQLCGP